MRSVSPMKPDSTKPELALTSPTASDTLDSESGATTDLMQPVFAARDVEWEAELLTHLSEQEQRLREFTRRRFQTEPHGVVQLAVRMVQALDVYTALHAERATLIRLNLPATRQASGEFIRKAETLPKPESGRKLLGFTVSAPRVSPEARVAAAMVVAELPAVIESYLLLLGNGFATGPMAAKWVETIGVFVRQLTKLTKHITDAQ